MNMCCAVTMYHPASFHAPHVPHNSQYSVPALSPPNPTVAYASRRSSTVTSADVDTSNDTSPLRIIDHKKQRIHDQLYRSGSVINNFPIKPQSTSPVAISKSSPTEEGNEGQYNTAGAQYDVKYISSSCVLVTYYSGDVTSVVDDHFSKALNLYSSESAPVPMSQRILPASFWDSSPSPSCSNSSSSAGGCLAGPSSSSSSYSRHQFYPAASTDPYHHSVSLAAGLSQPPPAEWYYHTHPHQHPISAGHHQGYGHPHAAAASGSSAAGSSAAVAAVQQNLAYGAAAAAAVSRYNQYPSLLLQSAAAGRLGMQQSATLDPASYPPYMYPSGLDGSSVGETASKDLYWFQ